MKLEISDLFYLYPTVFLAAIFAAWILFSLSRRSLHLPRGRDLKCGCCGRTIRVEWSKVTVRCTECGYRNKVVEMKP